MSNAKYYPAILILEDGSKYYGWSFKDSILSLGEIVFNTGMTGYQEIITDPSYAGQIITFTYPEIGNNGINKNDNESKNIHIKGIIAKNISLKPSNWRSEISFSTYLLKNNIPHIFGIDTRSLTRNLRYKGVMNGCISSKILDIETIKSMTKKSPQMEGLNLVNQVTTNKIYQINNIKDLGKSNLNYSHLNYKTHLSLKYNTLLTVTILDFGVKDNIFLRLLNYGCKINILPANSTYETILASNPDGMLLSNGPGDPAVMTEAVSNIHKLTTLTSIPIFGICMGHQILSLALGGQTFKLKFGHRGINHPIGLNQTAEITSQNHGFAVNSNSLLKNNLKITHFNLNDLTVAGIIHKNKPFFSVQYHPEASPGPHDSEYLFYHFIYLMKLIKSQ